MARIKFLNTYIDNLTMDQAVDAALKLVKERKNSYVVTPNLDHIVLLETDELFQNAYGDADLILADGKPLIWISKYLKNPIIEKVSGSDFFPNVCKKAAKEGYSIFILGAAAEVAEKAGEILKNNNNGLEIAGTYSPPLGFEKDSSEMQHIIEMITFSKPDILAVALGSPKGEKFIYQNLNKLNVPLSMSIGATIDFIAGNVKRCPKWMSNVGLEWVYRICSDPKRMWKRYWNDAKKIGPIIRKYRGKKINENMY